LSKYRKSPIGTYGLEVYGHSAAHLVKEAMKPN